MKGPVGKLYHDSRSKVIQYFVLLKKIIFVPDSRYAMIARLERDLKLGLGDDTLLSLVKVISSSTFPVNHVTNMQLNRRPTIPV